MDGRGRGGGAGLVGRISCGCGAGCDRPWAHALALAPARASSSRMCLHAHALETADPHTPRHPPPTRVYSLSRCWAEVMAASTDWRFTRDLMLEAVPYSLASMAAVWEICTARAGGRGGCASGTVGRGVSEAGARRAGGQAQIREHAGSAQCCCSCCCTAVLQCWLAAKRGAASRHRLASKARPPLARHRRGRAFSPATWAAG